MSRLSLKCRMSLAAAGILACVLSLLGLFIHLSARAHMLEVATDNLRGQARLAAVEISDLLSQRPGRFDPDSLAGALATATGRRVTIVDSSGRVVGDSEEDEVSLVGMDNHLGRPEIRAAARNGWGYSVRYSHTIKKDLIYLAVPIAANGRLWGYCRVAWPMSAFYSYQKHLAAIVLAGLLASGILLLLAFDRLWRRTIRGIAQVEAAARSIIGGDLSARAPTNLGGPEIERISLTLNRMAESWERTAGELNDRNAKIAAILDGMSEGVLVVGPDRRVSMINRAAAAMLGAREDAAGRGLLELIRHPGVQDLAEGSIAELEFEAADRHYLAHSSPLGSGEGKVVVLADVTRLKRLEKTRRDFVANVSHELKTPLAAILGFTEALEDGAARDPGTAGDFVSRIRRQARGMAGLVDDLLELSSLESAAVRLETAAVGARGLAEKVVEGFSPSASAKGQRITVSGSPHWGSSVVGDESRLVQALGNLVDNAVKYSPEGAEIILDAFPQEGLLAISVADRGPGIDAEHLPRLFERFYRVDKSRSRELGGTGLGLAIAKHIVGLHGGKVGVESEPGHGSRFWMSLPLAGL